MGVDDWESLGLPRSICDLVVRSCGFQVPMDVQKATIPLFLSHKDVVVEAVTGSGKTLAFLLPMLKMLLEQQNSQSEAVSAPHSLIIAPTRDLATQIFAVANALLKHAKHLRACLILGGPKSCHQNIQNFLGKNKTPAHIVISTPGRFAELLELSSPEFNLKQILKSLQVLILDEADRLLDLGFQERLTTILHSLPKQRRTGLFSATQTESLEDIIRAGLRNPVRVTVHNSLKNSKGEKDSGIIVARTPAKLENFFVKCTGENKLDHLLSFLSNNLRCKILLFVATSSQVNYFRTFLPKLLPSLTLLTIHGKMKKKRDRIVQQFRSLSSGGVLASTDLLSRGIDIEGIDWVLQYDPPSSATSFVHRCGRTARADRAGSAMVFLMPNELDYVNFLQVSLKTPLKEMRIDLKPELVNSADRLRTFAQNDRSVLELGTRAFVSYVQAYKKHECGDIFNLKNLNFGEIANGFGLLRLPRMPELGKRDVSAFKRSDVDTSQIKFLDDKREAERLERVKKLVEEGAKVKKINANKKKVKIEKKKKKKLAKIPKTRFTADEIDELMRDSAILKRSKKRKVEDEELLKELDCDID